MNKNYSSSNSGDSDKTQIDLQKEIPYESNPYNDHQPCRECGSKNVFTRIFVNEKIDRARYLCYNCADNYVEYRDYTPLLVKVNIIKEKER